MEISQNEVTYLLLTLVIIVPLGHRYLNFGNATQYSVIGIYSLSILFYCLGGGGVTSVNTEPRQEVDATSNCIQEPFSMLLITAYKLQY